MTALLWFCGGFATAVALFLVLLAYSVLIVGARSDRREGE